MCSKWIKCDEAEAEGYDTKAVILCSKCFNMKHLYLVHDEYGDYTCYQCNEGVSVRHVCIYCRNSGKFSRPKI